MKTQCLLTAMAASSLFTASAGAAVVFSDDFSEASGTLIEGKSSDVGGNWSTEDTGLAISSVNSLDTSGFTRDAQAAFTDALGAGETLTLTYDARVPTHDGFAVIALRESFNSTEQVTLGSLWFTSWGRQGGIFDFAVSSSGDTTTAAAGVLTSFSFTYEYDTGAWTYTGLGGAASGTGNAEVALATIDIRNGGGGDIEVDNLVVQIVPEPSSLALLGLGGLLIARRRRG